MGEENIALITPDTRLLRAPDALVSELDGEVVMMDVESGVYFTLDPIGSDIWRRLDDATTFGALCAALDDDYDADRDTIERDMLAFVEAMLQKGLLHAEA